MQKIKKFKSEIAQFSQNKANFPPFFLLAFSSGGIPPPQIPPFLRRNTNYNYAYQIFSFFFIEEGCHREVVYIFPKSVNFNYILR